MRDPKNYAFNWRTAPRPSMTNELVFGLNQFAFDFQYASADMSQINISIGAPVTLPDYYDLGNARRLKTWQFVDNFAWFRGPHTVKFGANFRFGSHQDTRGSIGGYNATQNANFSRTINTVDATRFSLPADINQQTTANPLETNINFLLGRVGNTNRGFTSEGDAFVPGTYDFLANFNEYDFYVQDTWKIARNLTIDLGLRLEMKMAPTNPDDRIRRPDQVAVAGAAPSNTLKWVPGDLYRRRQEQLRPVDRLRLGSVLRRQDLHPRQLPHRLRPHQHASCSAPRSSRTCPGIVIGDQDVTFGQNGGRLRNLPAAEPAHRQAERPRPARAILHDATSRSPTPTSRSPTTHQWSFSIQREILQQHGLRGELHRPPRLQPLRRLQRQPGRDPHQRLPGRRPRPSTAAARAR